MNGSRNYPESTLIEAFMSLLDKSEKFRPKEIYNSGSDTLEFSDIEFISEHGEHLIIEAKSNETSDAPNTVYKIFGQLIKEAGKTNVHRAASQPIYAVLIPDDTPTEPRAPKAIGSEYYQRRFSEIPENLFLGYGKLVGVKYIFCCSRNNYIDVYLWEDFYAGNPACERIA